MAGTHEKIPVNVSASHPSLLAIGDAATAIFLLRNYEKYGLSERVCYHFDLTEALLQSDEEQDPSRKNDNTYPDVCGVVSLLECSSLTPWHRMTKRQKRVLKNEIRSFNQKAQKVREDRSTTCYEPKSLPLKLYPSTRAFFAYEVTRIAFCVDASASLTSTFGIKGGPQSRCCPLDKLPEMSRKFFSSLVEPVMAPCVPDHHGVWRPELAVSVIAVFPLGKHAETNLLVRDYRVHDADSARLLSDHIEEWIRGEVELGISSRACRRQAASTWSVPLYSSSLRDILEAGDYALSILSSEARPLIVVATDCRSVSCDGIMDDFLDPERVDVPLVVLDLSNPETHVPFSTEDDHPVKSEPNFLTYDPGGPSAFPLYLSDDSEALYDICKATGGCFLDSQLLCEAASSVAGQQTGFQSTRSKDETNRNEAENPLGADHYYSFKRRFVKMNGVQFLTLFALSPLSPTFHASWGKVLPPHYLRRRLALGMVDVAPREVNEGRHPLLQRHESSARQGSDVRLSGVAIHETSHGYNKRHISRVTFSTYMVSPIRIKGLLMMLIKEGYRAKQYGQSTQEPDKVYIQFTLPLQMGTILHYELSFKALSNQNHMLGTAYVKIELSGDPSFIQSVKNDFLRQAPDGSKRPFTMAQKISARLCKVLRYIRKEDCLESYLCPPSHWSDQLSTPDAPFVRRLEMLTLPQRRIHFQFDEFDVICTGRMPYAQDDDFLSHFMAVDNGEQELFDGVGAWSTQTIKQKCRYVKAVADLDGISGYCVIEIRQSPVASRLFTISIESLCGLNPCDRLALVASLKTAITNMKDVEVLGKQMGQYLVGKSHSLIWKKRNVEIEYHHASWDLVMDPELLPLLMKRRTEIGEFKLLQSSNDYAVFAKLIPDSHRLGSSPGDLIQYQIRILQTKVVIDLHMESESGVFSPFRAVGKVSTSRFHRMAMILRRRDQECGRALRSRTNLLRVFNTDNEEVTEDDEDHLSSVTRILAYSSRVSRRLRFFNPRASAANDALVRITEELLLSESFGARAAKLQIDPLSSVRDEDSGIWFILQFNDMHIMSLVHLSLVDKRGNKKATTYTFRELTFFTIGISDLYSKRDDVVDDDSVDSHISEYLCVTEFADLVEAAHKQNYAAASYIALRKALPPIIESFDSDFSEVLSACAFQVAASVTIAGVSSSSSVEATEGACLGEEQSKLSRVIYQILRPVPGDNHCLFYCGGGNHAQSLRFDGSDDESIDSDDVGSAEEESHERESRDNDQLMDSSSHGESDTDVERSNLVSPPIFFRFKLDGKNVSVRDLYWVSKSATLTAEISIFKRTPDRKSDPQAMPWSHQAAALELNAHLQSYVAEQTIERLRHCGPSITDQDLRIVKKCLNRVQSVISFSIEVFFYVAKTDSMVTASAPAGGESEVEEGFRLLNFELQRNRSFKLELVSGGGFVVIETGNEKAALEFWCFVKVLQSEGIISASIYHPNGEEMALKVMSNIHDVISSCVHRVNQHLLLKR